ncbi:muscle M-line assembly protein unc-89 isoform X1 [Garra rufa]|uniref:muscle M-line assembly protein unc-89 isoform X1 n=1 Tax=Garra rufa TaxID=137080 RepID=UPI003CCEF55B
MSCKSSLVFLSLCGFAALTVSTQTCGKELLEGMSCTIKLKMKNNEKPNEIKWVSLSSGAFIYWKKGKIKTNTLDVKMEEDGSLTFENVSLKDTGKYKYNAFNIEGTEIATREEEIIVYAKAPKPTVTFIRGGNGNAVLTCDFGERTDLTVSWNEEDKIIQNEKKSKLLLTSDQVQENKPYSCSVSNPVSNEQSDSVIVSFSTRTCGKELLEGTSCTIKLKTKRYERPEEIKWIHLSSSALIIRKRGKIKTNTRGVKMEDDGSLTFESVRLKDSGKYKYYAYNDEGREIANGEEEINVYAKAPKPTVKISCKTDGDAALTCDIGDHTNLIISWYKEAKIIQNEKKPELLLTSAQVQQNKVYSCSVSNPVSSEQSDSITVSFSTQTCGKELLEGTSCTIKLQTKPNEKPDEIKWIHLSSGALFHKKKEKIKINTLSGEIDENGSLILKSVRLNNTGKYKFNAFNKDGTEIGNAEVEIIVYAKAPKPTVKDNCNTDGTAALTCDIGDQTDLTVSWSKENKIIEKEKEKVLLLKPAEVQENKPYSCSVSNPASSEQSESITVSCTGGTSQESGPRKLFGFDFWIMVGILAGGGALLLLLICVLVICACRSCKQQEKEQDEDELRLRVFQDPASTGTARSKHTARGQPAPPVPQEVTSPETPPQTQAQPKAQTRARPPPPPEDNEEYPPPLPRPRNKQHRKRNEEPYRPME